VSTTLVLVCSSSTGLLQHLPARAAGVARVQRYPHGAGDRTADEQVGGAEVVVLQARDPVAGLDAETAQPVGEPDAAVPGLAEGERAVLGDEGGPFVVEGSRLPHEARNVHCRDSFPGRRLY
jgi:hypothetical protein